MNTGAQSPIGGIKMKRALYFFTGFLGCREPHKTTAERAFDAWLADWARKLVEVKTKTPEI